MSTGRTVFQLGYQLSPIILTAGIAQNVPGNLLPIVALTQAASFIGGLLEGNISLNPDDYFAQFQPISGSSLQSYQIGQYPFANQAVAANAMIAQPLQLSMEMICPVREQGGYIAKIATLTALKKSLDQHIAQGGTFTVATPGYIYTNMILRSLRDITEGNSKQKQIRYQWDFEQPLIAQDTAQNAYNSLMSKIAGALPIVGTPSWSGLASAVGSSISGAVTSLIPSASSLVGTLTGSGTVDATSPLNNTENSFGGT